MALKWGDTTTHLEVEVRNSQVYIRLDQDMPEELKQSLMDSTRELSEEFEQSNMSLAYLGDEKSTRDSEDSDPNSSGTKKRAGVESDESQKKDQKKVVRKGVSLDVVG